MNRSSRDSDQPYVLRRQDNSTRDNKQYEEYDAHDQLRPTNQSNYERASRISYYTYDNQQSPSDRQPAVDRRTRDSIDEEHVYSPAQTAYRVSVDSDQEVVRRVNPSNQTAPPPPPPPPPPPKVDYTVRQAPSTNPRTVVLDINITISVGNSNRNPQVIATTNNIPIRTLPARSTAVLQDVGYVDLDLRAPERTGRLATDGIIRSSSATQSTNYLNDNHDK